MYVPLPAKNPGLELLGSRGLEFNIDEPLRGTELILYINMKKDAGYCVG